MSLLPVSEGDPHVPAHNAERDAINDLQDQIVTKIDLPASATLGSLLRWDGDDWRPTLMRLFEGDGSPEGVVSAPVGSRYVDALATGGVAEWFKQSGTGNTGWTPLSTGIPWTNVTLGTGYAHVAGDPGQATLVNGTVYFRGTLRRTSGTGTNMGTLPAGMFPPKNISNEIRAGSDWLGFSIGPTGILTINGGVVSNQDIPLGSASGAPYRIV